MYTHGSTVLAKRTGKTEVRQLLVVLCCVFFTFHQESKVNVVVCVLFSHTRKRNLFFIISLHFSRLFASKLNQQLQSCLVFTRSYTQFCFFFCVLLCAVLPCCSSLTLHQHLEIPNWNGVCYIYTQE